MIRKSEAGQALVLAAVAMLALLGVMGLAIDMGVLRYDKRVQQTAADAAAVAGANELAHGDWEPAAQNASTGNGFKDVSGNTLNDCYSSSATVGTVCVEIDSPPSDGPHKGDTGCSPAPSCYVEARVAVVQPTYFAKVFGVTRETVLARAVATSMSGDTANDACLYTLGPPSASIEGVNMSGSATLNAPSCGIVDNGDFNTNGNALTVNADTFAVSGCTVWGNKCKTGTMGSISCPSDCPTTGATAVPDPLQGLASPCTQGYTCTICPSGYGCTVSDPSITINSSGTGCVAPYCSYSGGTYTISQGTYSSITITGVSSGSGPSIDFEPGMYIIDGSGTGDGLNETGNASVTCSKCVNGIGTTFYFLNNSTVNITGNPVLNLSAPSSGTYSGILMYQAPCPPGALPAQGTTCGTSAPYDVNLSQNYMLSSDTGPQLGGTSGSNYAGILYFPSDQLTFYGHSNNCTGCGTFQIGEAITYSIALNGDPNVNIAGASDVPGGASLIKNAVLVE